MRTKTIYRIYSRTILKGNPMNPKWVCVGSNRLLDRAIITANKPYIKTGSLGIRIERVRIEQEIVWRSLK